MSIDLRERPIPTVTIAPNVALRPRARAVDPRPVVLTLAMGSGALAAVFSDASPVGLDIADAMYRAVFGATIVWFASRARRWTWTVLACVATAVASSLLVQTLCAVTLIGAVKALLGSGKRNGLVGASVAAICVPALMTQGADPLWRLSGGRVDDWFATSALLTAAACTPVLASGWKTLSRRRRRTLRRALRRASLAGGLVVLITAVASVAALPRMLDGLSHSRAATDAANAGELELASKEFEAAAQQWETANSRLTRPWLTPARLLPVVGQHVRALQVVTGQAAALHTSADALTERVDPEELVVDGTVALDELDELSPAADALAATTSRASTRIADARSPWLAPPLSRRMDRAVELLGRAAGLVGASAEALHTADTVLGRGTPAQTLVLVSTPAEARGAGGFVGNWIVLESEDGKIDVAEHYQSRELNRRLEQVGATIDDDRFVERYGRFAVERHIQDVTLSPDFPSVAKVAADLFAQATGEEAEAVLMVDPFVLEKLLGLTGPIDIGAETPLTGANAATYLLIDQYERYADAEVQREAHLRSLSEELMRTLIETPPDPIAFVTELAPLAEQKRMSLWIRGDDGTIVDRLGLSGAFPESTDGLLSVVHQNAGQNKIDPYLERSVDIRTTLSPSNGAVDHRVVITLDNNALRRGARRRGHRLERSGPRPGHEPTAAHRLLV